MSDIKKKKCIGVCMGGSCYNNGSEKIMDYLEEQLGVSAGTSNDEVDLDFVGCLGNCDFGVNIEVDGEILTDVTESNVLEVIATGQQPESSSRKPADSLDSMLKDELAGL